MTGPERPRPSRPAALGGAAWGLVWVLVIALGSSLVWVVISSAGSGVSETLETSTVATVPVEVTLPPAVSPHPSRSPSSSSSSAPASPVQQATWTGPAGAITVECRGSAVSLVGAYPSADGWVVEVKDRGPERVEAEFEGRGEQEGAETRVRAECVSGVPEFEERAESD
jgi:hypothetical protein